MTGELSPPGTRSASTQGWAGHTYPIAPSGSGDPFAGFVASASRNPDHLDVFWVRPDGAVVTTWWDAAVAGGWHAEPPIAPPGSASVESRVTAVCRDELHVGVFWAGPHGTVRHTEWGPAGWPARA